MRASTSRCRGVCAVGAYSSLDTIWVGRGPWKAWVSAGRSWSSSAWLSSLIAGSSRRGQASEERLQREPDPEQAAVAAGGAVELEPDRQAGGGAADRHAEARDPRVAARIGVLGEGEEGRHVRPVQL